ncbi:rab geranylgeranyltransferase, variant 3 [Coprinopsis cinerea AmutBmut pab1-1]|nr:rab geranylgeranyltransferase, variant 3 [Coprinopsis cinerea AmutBmut pab1-1]
MATNELLVPLHVSYIQKLGQNKDDLTYHLTSHLRLNAVYWGLTALAVMGHQDALNREEMIDFVMSCWDEEQGAFGAHPDHDAHLLSTLSAIQILIMQDALDRVDVDRVVKYILSLQQPSGVFAGDNFGEIDTRFLYCAVSALSLLGRLDELDKEKTVGYLKRCKNYDGGFGSVVGAESHAAQVFVCTAALAILDKLDEVVDTDTLGWWLAERQLPNGGLNGRPEKLEDVSNPLSIKPLSDYAGVIRFATVSGSSRHSLSSRKSRGLTLRSWKLSSSVHRMRKEEASQIDQGIWSMYSIPCSELPGFRYWAILAWSTWTRYIVCLRRSSRN